MTVATGSRSSTAGNGTTTEFSATFRANSPSEIGVSLVNTTTFVAAVQVLTTNYSVDLNDDGLPTVTFVVAPPTGDTVLIYPNPDVKQPSSIAAGSPLYGSTIEEALDKIAAILQRHEDRLGQCLRIPASNVALAELAGADTRDNTFITFNASGAPALRPLSDVGL